MEREASDARDRELGMSRKISRRDFLDGVAIGAGALVAGGWLAACTPSTQTGSSIGGAFTTPHLQKYPPAATGFAGQTDAAAAIPHMLRDGTFWEAAGSPEVTGETYDLVVVGGGISGLSSAYLYSQQHPDARILILDALEDFGGHAHRNEFSGVKGRKDGLLLSFGGGESIEAPALYSPGAKALLEGIGVNVERLGDAYQGSFYKGGSVTNFSKEVWGRDHAVVRTWDLTTEEEVRDAPMAEQAKKDLVMLENAPDWMPGLSDEQKKKRLSEITYLQFLVDVAKVHPDAAKFLQNHAADDWGYGINCQGAIDAWPAFHPGFDGMHLDASKPSKYNSPSWKKLWDDDEPYTFHFPDGNAAIARLLVRDLIPGTLPGKTMEDEVLAQLDYGKLDAANNRVRIRLGSPVVRVKHMGDPATASEVEVAYVQGNQLKTVRAKGAIMSCWYSMTPYIVDGYPEEQREAAASMGRVPLAYVNVVLRDRKAFDQMKVWGGRNTGPGVLYSNFYLDWPVSMGGYEYPMNYDEPGVLHLSSHPTRADMPMHEATKAGREDMFATSFAEYERGLRELLATSMAAGGFDPAEEIQAITVNRWAHGYSQEYVTPFDNAFYPDGPFPGDIAAQPFGRITFANTDRISVAYMDAAIDAAGSAVDEQLSRQ